MLEEWLNYIAISLLKDYIINNIIMSNTAVSIDMNMYI